MLLTQPFFFRRNLVVFLFCMLLVSSAKSSAQEIKIPLQPGEKVWSGNIHHGYKMPLTEGYTFDFYGDNLGNQTQPLIITNKGLWVWSEEPYAFRVEKDQLIVSNAKGEIKNGRAGNTLASARNYASATFFPASGKLPDELLFSKPQYNTWIELTYNQNQADVLKYAHAIIDNGFAPGVLMIDDTWQEDYGKWVFHPGRFPDPKKMMDELHKMGFKVMVWVCPFVSADQFLIVREVMKGKGFLLKKDNPQTTWEKAKQPAMIHWWNGHSALLDFTNPAAEKWFSSQLENLVNEFGVDGFKLDAGDMDFYSPDALSMKPASPNKQCELYGQIGLRFPLNEYRACWKLAGQPLAQRLRDKTHKWDDLTQLIPNMIALGLNGYTFSCPDMIGGGEFSSFLDLKAIDQDLVVRSAQIHALMPMMQFSVAPWRILDTEHLNAVKEAVKIREKYTPIIMELAKKSAQTGNPIISSLEYFFPGQGFENISNQFMLGENILVAPLDQKGTSRTVALPKGKWLADDGKIYKGGKTYSIEVPLNRLPYFVLQK